MANRLGRQIRKLRRSKSWTQAVLARKAGRTETCIATIERGETAKPKPKTLFQLAEALDTDPRELFKAAGMTYPTRQSPYEERLKAAVDPDLLRTVARMSRSRQSELLDALKSGEIRI